MGVRTGMGRSGVLAALAATLSLADPAARAAEPTDAQETKAPAPPPQYYRLRSPWLDPEIAHSPPRAQETNVGLAAFEVASLNVAIWGLDKITGQPYADISLESWGRNFDKGWIIDTDDFWINGLLHPVHGSFDYEAARSLGVGFYGSFGYTFGASLLWEEFGETQAPSFNDQINTPFGGSLFGEVRFRLHHLILDSGGLRPGFWRRFFAFLVAPIAGVNELAFQERYRGPLVLPLSWRGDFSAGALVTGTSTGDQPLRFATALGPWARFAVHILYGVPGTPGLRLEHPFDHFSFELALSATGSQVQAPLTLLIRGLLVGDTVGPGGEFGGVWGLYASYDFVASQLFRVSGFGFGPGVSLAKRWGGVDLYGTALLEAIPWGAAGLTVPLGARDYHYGVGAQGLVELRMDLVNRVTIRASARQFLVTDSYTSGESEGITHARLALQFRIWGPHALTLESTWSRRNSQSRGAPILQRAWVLGAEYTVLSGW